MIETRDESEYDGNLGPTELTKFNQTNKQYDGAFTLTVV